MRTLVNKFLIGASIAAGVSAIATSPAFAGNLTNASIGGTAASDYYVYDAINGKTTKVDSTLANVTKVLNGDATSPTGNVELRASSENPGFDFKQNTTLTGNIGGRDITLSSLTASDWESKDANGVTLVKRWFDNALTANGFGKLLGNNLYYNIAYNKFVTGGGLQRFSDPNISYVNQDDTGLIKIGLAGHYDATSLLLGSLNTFEKSLVNALRDTDKVGTKIQASEIVKYTYDGKTDYLYSFQATETKLSSDDNTKSHNGNYEVSIQGKPPVKSTPEPSVMLGMLVVGGVFATQRKLKKA
jgi:hypothetical protein